MANSKLFLTDNNCQSYQSSTKKISRIRELEKIELMRKREDCYLRSIWNVRDWLERKRPFSNSYKFKENISNSLILDKNNF